MPPQSIQLAIQGGGAKICALLGAADHIQSLQNAGRLKITRIAATSAGAIAGALLAARVPIADVRAKLLAIPPSDWRRMFPQVTKATAAFRLLRGKTILDPTHLKNVLKSLLPDHLRTLGHVQDVDGIPLYLTATDLSSASLVINKDREKPLLAAILDSAGLPFIYRAGVGGGHGIVVDGGICENLPADILLQEDQENLGPLIGISFVREGQFDVLEGVLPFAKALLSTAMSHSVSRSCAQIGPNLVIELRPTLDTFDFARVQTVGLTHDYEAARTQTSEWFRRFLASRKPSSIAMGDPWSAPAAKLMLDMEEIYNAQHGKRTLRYHSTTLECVANCLLREVDPSHEWAEAPDQFTYTVELSPHEQPLECYHYGLSSSGAGGYFPFCEYRATDAEGSPIPCVLFPTLRLLGDVPITGEAALDRRFLLFFVPPIDPAAAAEVVPMVRLQFMDQVAGSMKGLLGSGEGPRCDYLGLHQRRPPALPFPLRVVLHVPQGFPHLRAFQRHKKGWHSCAAGREMGPAELSAFRAPKGFRSYGFQGTAEALHDYLGATFEMTAEA